MVYADGRKRLLDPAHQPVGLSGGEAILPYQLVAFDGHRVLQEYFVFPDKFCGYDLLKLAGLFDDREEAEFSFEFLFDQPLPADARIRTDNVQLYCVPSVNLFQTDADPLIIDHTKLSYHIRAHSFDSEHVEFSQSTEFTGSVRHGMKATLWLTVFISPLNLSTMKAEMTA